MRMAFHRVESDCFKLIYDKETVKEATLELVVPDICADIGKILDVRGQILYTSKKAKTDEIFVGASVHVTVIYAAEDEGAPQCVSADILLDQTIPAKGATDDASVTVRFELCKLEAKLLNPRKLLIRAEAASRVCCYLPDKFVLWDGAEGECRSVHMLRRELEHSLVVGVREKCFTVSDEYHLPADRSPNSKMVSSMTEICVREAKAVGNKLIFKANAVTTAVFLCDESGELFSCTFDSQFSQIIEMDAYGDSIESFVSAQLREADFTPLCDRIDGGAIAVTLNILGQAVCTEKKCSAYIADAYSNECTLDAETADVNYTKILAKKAHRFQLRGAVQAEAPLREVLYLAPVEVCTDTQGGELSCYVKICGVGVCEKGELHSVEAVLKASEGLQLEKNQQISVLAVCCEPLSIIQNAEVCMELCIEYEVCENGKICAVCALELHEECPVRQEGCPSLVVLCAEKDSDIWVLAKKYGSTTKMIETANCKSGEFCASQRPLLIPKA
ncbi:MAG: DUF3794 domain-containing protein [Oscillospiraceae bacterium]